MVEKLYMSAKYWHQDDRVRNLQKKTRTCFFGPANPWTSVFECGSQLTVSSIWSKLPKKTIWLRKLTIYHHMWVLLGPT